MSASGFSAWRGPLGGYYIEQDYADAMKSWWTYSTGCDHSSLQKCGFVHGYGQPPSETLKTLIAAGGPWYAVLDKFVEEYPQWEEVLTWAPQGVAE